jgi:hypothetical protein
LSGTPAVNAFAGRARSAHHNVTRGGFDVLTHSVEFAL